MRSESAFPSRPFVLFWRAHAVSGLGTYVTLLALQALVVLDLGGSATEVGWLSSARWLPFLVVGVVVGALVDRRPRRPVAVVADLVAAVLLAVVPLLWWTGLLTFPVLLAVVVAYGTASVVSTAATTALLPRLVAPADLQRAHARTDGADAAAMTAGPALGGLLVSALGAPLAVLADAATYLLSAATLARVDVDEPAPVRGAGVRALLGEIRDGVVWIYRSSGLATLAVATHVWFVGNAVVGVVLAPYALLQLGVTPLGFGVVGAVGGAGALLGAVVTTRVGLRWGTGRTIIACHATTLLGVLVMVAAAAPSSSVAALGVLALGQGLYGLAMGASNSHEMSYRQLLTPDGLQARTNTTLRSLNRAVMVVVAPVAGVLADAWGYDAALLVAGAVFAAVVAGLGASPFRSVRAPT